MLKLNCLVLALFSSTALLADDGQPSIEQKLANLKLERMQAEVMIKTMVRSGRMDEREARHAGRAIASVKEEDVQVIREEALETLKTSKTFATK